MQSCSRTQRHWRGEHEDNVTLEFEQTEGKVTFGLA